MTLLLMCWLELSSCALVNISSNSRRAAWQFSIFLRRNKGFVPQRHALLSCSDDQLPLQFKQMLGAFLLVFGRVIFLRAASVLCRSMCAQPFLMPSDSSVSSTARLFLFLSNLSCFNLRLWQPPLPFVQFPLETPLLQTELLHHGCHAGTPSLNFLRLQLWPGA